MPKPSAPTPPTPAAPASVETAVAADERDRQAAARSDAALVAYQQKWDSRIARLQRAHPSRWRVGGWSDEEVRDALTLRLIEAVRGPSAEAPARPCPPSDDGKEWGLRVVERHLALLRKTFRLRTRAVDLRQAPLPARGPTEEERWLEREADAARAVAARLAELALNRPQRRWLAALHEAARAGAFFRSSDAPNLSAASRLLGKHRSSAQRAFQELQAHFDRERRRLE